MAVKAAKNKTTRFLVSELVSMVKSLHHGSRRIHCLT